MQVPGGGGALRALVPQACSERSALLQGVGHEADRGSRCCPVEAVEGYVPSEDHEAPGAVKRWWWKYTRRPPGAFEQLCPVQKSWHALMLFRSVINRSEEYMYLTTACHLGGAIRHVERTVSCVRSRDT